MKAFNRWSLRLIAACAIAETFAGSANAYNAETHQRLSSTAFRLSGVASTLASNGLRPNDTFKGRLPFFIRERHTAQDWVTIGGSDEDVPLNRVLNHFYDPIHDTGLTIPVIGGARAPDWALEDRGDLEGQNHSYKDARQAFYNALTVPKPTSREREWGHTFYALGHVIHMIQDMAAPEHTRDDAHFFIGPGASLMEKYLERNIDAFTLGGAPMPRVSRARALWVSESKRGLAQFSNANFVSPDTNFTALRTGATAERFPEPRLDLSRADDSPVGACNDGAEPPQSANRLVFYGNEFSDPVTGNKIENLRMTTHSVFDQDLVERFKRPVFALNCFNIDTAGDILLPRAVAYSAALLQHFFRGRLEARVQTIPTQQGTFASVQFFNRTPGEEMMEGSFELYADAHDGTRIPLIAWPRMTLGPDQGSAPTLVGPLPQDIAPGKPWTLVFRGRLGEEADAVAGVSVGFNSLVVVARASAGATTADFSGALGFGVGPAAAGPMLPLLSAMPVLALETHVCHAQFGRPCLGEEHRHEMWALYRDVTALPGDTAALTVDPRSHCVISNKTSLEPFPFGTGSTSFFGVAAQLVEFVEPTSLDAVSHYTWPGPPVARILASVTEATGTLMVRVGEGRFFGVMLTSEAPATGSALGYQNGCGLWATVQFTSSPGGN